MRSCEAIIPDICSGFIRIIESVWACIMDIIPEFPIPDIPRIAPLSIGIPLRESPAGASLGLLHAADAKRPTITVM
jgi:hypothetical protein